MTDIRQVFPLGKGEPDLIEMDGRHFDVPSEYLIP